MRVQAARHPFHHDHGALQQDQLGARFHAEAFGHFEQIGQQPRHRDAAGIHAEDRLAHGPQRAGEFIDVAVGRHIAGLEMHFRHAPVILADEAEQNLGIDAAGIFIDPAHDAEIIGDDVAIRGHLQVALMHVGMEIAVAQRMVQEQMQHPVAQNPAVMACRVNRRIVGHRHAFGPAQRHHGAARQVPDRLGHLKPLILCRVRGKFRCGRAFQPQVQLAQHHALEMRDHIHRTQTARGR